MATGGNITRRALVCKQEEAAEEQEIRYGEFLAIRGNITIKLYCCTGLLIFRQCPNDGDEHANLMMNQICYRTKYIIRSCSATSASFIPQPEAGAKPSSETVNIYVELNFFLFLSASWTQF